METARKSKSQPAAYRSKKKKIYTVDLKDEPHIDITGLTHGRSTKTKKLTVLLQASCSEFPPFPKGVVNSNSLVLQN